MKIRNGFVSNSSSSSFIIDKKHLTEEQIDLIVNHFDEIRKRENEGTYNQHIHCYDEWSVHDIDDKIEVSTSMDNFDMYSYLINVVKVNPDNIEGYRDEDT